MAYDFDPNPLRSVLYAPAHSMSLFIAALEARPDAVIIDLEDGVPDDEKPLARLGLSSLVERARSIDVVVVVRVNGMDTEWFQDDLAVALDASPDAILLPKAAVESVEALAEAIGGATKIWGLVERIRDVLAIEALASLGALDVVTIGYGDLCKELGVPLGSAHPEFVGVRELVVAAARRHDIVALDGVFIGSADASGAACAESRAAGFAGRTLYRPAHVAGCHDAFTAAV